MQMTARPKKRCLHKSVLRLVEIDLYVCRECLAVSKNKQRWRGAKGDLVR